LRVSQQGVLNKSIESIWKKHVSNAPDKK
jgi:hypothetical protein